MWSISEVFIAFVTILLLFYVLVFWPGGIWAPSSPPGNRNYTPCIGSGSFSVMSNSLWPHDCSQESLCWGITLMGAGYKSLAMGTDVLAFNLVPKRISGEWSGRSATWESRFPDLFYRPDSEFSEEEVNRTWEFIVFYPALSWIDTKSLRPCRVLEAYVSQDLGRGDGRR